MIDLGEEIYEILSENGWKIIEWGERIGRGWFYNIEYVLDNETTVEETVNCVNDSREAFIDGINDLSFSFDPEECATMWVSDESDDFIQDLLDDEKFYEFLQDLLNDANEIKDSLDNLRIALKDIDLSAEETM